MGLQMKTVLFWVIFSSTLATQAADFSAFVTNNVLYVTILGDSCNHVGGGLEVDGLCKKDRKTKNYAIECNAKLSIYHTEMACGDDTVKPKVVKIALEKTDVAPEARVLHLSYGKEKLTLDISK
jgi:hypothetical protein